MKANRRATKCSRVKHGRTMIVRPQRSEGRLGSGPTGSKSVAIGSPRWGPFQYRVSARRTSRSSGGAKRKVHYLAVHDGNVADAAQWDGQPGLSGHIAATHGQLRRNGSPSATGQTILSARRPRVVHDGNPRLGIRGKCGAPVLAAMLRQTRARERNERWPSSLPRRFRFKRTNGSRDRLHAKSYRDNV